MSIEQALIAEVRSLTPEQQQEVLNFAAFIRQRSATKSSLLRDIDYDPNAIPIWELAAQSAAKVPDEEWERLPTDLAKRFDYYQQQGQKQD
ncbi:MAG: hypothetical protein WBB01_14345 [Phormidesmis sp.]